MTRLVSDLMAEPPTAGCHALLIEAEEAYGAALLALVKLAGCRARLVRTPEIALLILQRHKFDIVIWGAPDLAEEPRIETIAELRLRTEAPLILVAGSFDTAGRDLEVGADQRIPKPFVPSFLVGAIRAALRKAGAPLLPVASRIKVRGVLLDGTSRTLTYSGRGVTFTRQEWELLLILESHSNRYLSAREILRLGWRAGDHGAEQVRIYVRRLRCKIEPLGLPFKLLSQHGLGYCLSFE